MYIGQQQSEVCSFSSSFFPIACFGDNGCLEAYGFFGEDFGYKKTKAKVKIIVLDQIQLQNLPISFTL